MKTYTTAEVAKIINVHSNTVILYEKWGYIKGVERKANGYRIFTDRHLEQMKIIRIASKNEFVKCGIRIKAVDIIRLAAKGDLEKAFKESKKYLRYIQDEKNKDFEVIKQALITLQNTKFEENDIHLKTNEVAKLLGVSNDSIIYWERNGVLNVPRNKKNGYRSYSEKEVALLKIVKPLRDAKYSVSAISKMVNEVKFNNKKTLRDIVYASDLDYNILEEVDKLLVPLVEVEVCAKKLVEYIGGLI